MPLHIPHTYRTEAQLAIIDNEREMPVIKDNKWQTLKIC